MHVRALAKSNPAMIPIQISSNRQLAPRFGLYPACGGRVSQRGVSYATLPVSAIKKTSRWGQDKVRVIVGKSFEFLTAFYATITCWKGNLILSHSLNTTWWWPARHSQPDG